MNAAKRHAQLGGDLGLRYLAGQPRDFAFLFVSDGAVLAVRIPQCVPVLCPVKLVLRIGLPFEVAWVDAAVVALTAIMRRLVLGGRWSTVGHLAHEAVCPIGPPVMS